MGAAAAVTIGVLASSHDPVSLSAFGQTVDPHDAGVVFLAGVVVGVAFALGLWLLLRSLLRSGRRRRERKRTARQVAAENRSLQKRNAELERTLATDRADGTGTGRPSTERTTDDADRYPEPSAR